RAKQLGAAIAPPRLGIASPVSRARTVSSASTPAEAIADRGASTRTPDVPTVARRRARSGLLSEPDGGGLEPGEKIGRYELLYPVARGGMATVWAARLHGSRGFQQIVALKILNPILREDPDAQGMLLDEARIASRIHHPNVCQVLDFGEDDDVSYIV